MGLADALGDVGTPFDRMAQDKYFGCVAIWNDGEMERRFSAWGPSSDEALQTAYTEALRSLN